MRARRPRTSARALTSMFLAEHELIGPGEGAEAFSEAEVAEVLAASWKDKRAELSRVQRARKFTQARDVRGSFRVEVEKLKKKKTQSHLCGRTGHWARECRMPRNSGQQAPAETASSSSGAGLAQPGEHFVCFVGDHWKVEKGDSMLDRLRARRLAPSDEILLVSSPGYAVLDSGCGRSIIGDATLAEFRDIWKRAGLEQPPLVKERNVFRFGNGNQEVTDSVIEMPIVMAGHRGIVRAAVIKGRAPLLISKQALKRLKARMNFVDDELTLFESQTPVPMITNEAGQYMIPVSEFEPKQTLERQGVSSCEENSCLSVEASSATPLKDYWVSQGLEVVRFHVQPRSELFTPATGESKGSEPCRKAP